MAKKEETPAPEKKDTKKLNIKKEGLKDLDVKKDSSVKGGGTATCNSTWKNCVIG